MGKAEKFVTFNRITLYPFFLTFNFLTFYPTSLHTVSDFKFQLIVALRRHRELDSVRHITRGHTMPTTEFETI